MMDKINQITFHFFETLWCKQSVSACYSAKTTVWETINGKFIPPPPRNQGWENGAFWRFNLDLGGTVLLFHLLLSKIAGLEIFIKVFR